MRARIHITSVNLCNPRAYDTPAIVLHKIGVLRNTRARSLWTMRNISHDFEGFAQ